jgi:hypothetical protein
MISRPSVALAIFVPLFASACTTSLTQGQTARALAPGKVELALSGSIPVSTRFASEVADVARASAARLQDADNADRPLTEQEQREALEAGLALALFHPAVVTELGGRVGIVDRFDVGLKYAGTLLKADGKYQFATSDDGGPDLAVALGLTHHLGYGASVLEPAYALLDFVSLSDYSRHDVELSLLASGEWDEIIALYGGIRYMASFISLDADIERVETASGIPHSSLSSTFHYAGVTGGLRVGYKYLYATLELTVMRVFAKPVVFGETRDLGGFIVSPSFGLLARF